MKSITATEAKNRLGAILDAAQREPIVIRRQGRDVGVILSIAHYDRLRSANVGALLDLRNEAAAEATAAGLSDKRLAELLNDDDACATAWCDTSNSFRPSRTTGIARSRTTR